MIELLGWFAMGLTLGLSIGFAVAYRYVREAATWKYWYKAEQHASRVERS